VSEYAAETGAGLWVTPLRGGMELRAFSLIRHMKTARWNMLQVMLVLALLFPHGAGRMDIMNCCALPYAD